MWLMSQYPASPVTDLGEDLERLGPGLFVNQGPKQQQTKKTSCLGIFTEKKRFLVLKTKKVRGFGFSFEKLKRLEG